MESTNETETKMYGILAEFETTAQIYHACEAVRDAGYQKWDAHTPFPVHGLDRAMGLKRSKLPWIVLVFGMTGACSAMFLQWWVSTTAQPVIIAAKPMFSWQAFIPITFEVGVLFSALAAVFGMLALNGLPQLYHSLFRSERFERVTDDKFFISIEVNDPQFDEVKTRTMLEQLGASHVEMVED